MNNSKTATQKHMTLDDRISIEKELLEKIREEVLKDSPDIREDRFDIDENWALEKMMEGGK